jgi:hypothetical protein
MVFEGEDVCISGVGVLVNTEVDASSLPKAFSRARAKTWTFSNRCCGSLARVFMTTSSTKGEMSDTFSRKDGGGARVCLTAISANDP